MGFPEPRFLSLTPCPSSLQPVAASQPPLYGLVCMSVHQLYHIMRALVHILFFVFKAVFRVAAFVVSVVIAMALGSIPE